jgi:hypothetical protein
MATSANTIVPRSRWTCQKYKVSQSVSKFRLTFRVISPLILVHIRYARRRAIYRNPLGATRGGFHL